MNYIYQQITLIDFVTQKHNALPAALFEQSIDWWQATQRYMLTPKAKVIVHCLFDKEVMIAAWPLAHIGKEFHSLSSFYSSSAEPLVDPAASCEQSWQYFFRRFQSENNFIKLHVGPITKHSDFYRALIAFFPKYLLHSQSDNFFQPDIRSVEHYMAQRPSQLKNTIKRKEKRLNNAHNTRYQLVTSSEDFEAHFPEYKKVYQLSWKGKEANYDFIEHVCRQAIKKNSLRLGLLWVDGRLAAAQIWFIGHQCASIFKLAYDPAYKAFSVGSLLSHYLSQTVIENDCVTEIEFGHGSEAYKKDWMGHCRQRETLAIYNPQNLYACLLYLTRSIIRIFKERAR